MSKNPNELETNELEDLLSGRTPAAPASLCGDVDTLVRNHLKRQTFRDDMKWMGISLSILLVAFAAQWWVFSNASKNCDELSSMIASTETAKKLPVNFGPQAFPTPTKPEPENQ